MGQKHTEETPSTVPPIDVSRGAFVVGQGRGLRFISDLAAEDFPVLREVLNLRTSDLKGISRISETSLAVNCKDQGVHLYDIAQGRIVKSLQGHTAPVDQSTFFSNHSILATGSEDCSIRLWRIDVDNLASDSTTFLRSFEHEQRVNGLQCAVDVWPNHLLSTSHDGTAKVWDVEKTDSSEPLGVLSHSQDWVRAIDVNFNGDSLFTGGRAGTVRRWDAATFEETGSFDIVGPVTGGGGDPSVFSVLCPKGEQNLNSLIVGTMQNLLIYDQRNLVEAVQSWDSGTTFLASIVEVDENRFATSSWEREFSVWTYSGENVCRKFLKGKSYGLAYIPPEAV